MYQRSFPISAIGIENFLFRDKLFPESLNQYTENKLELNREIFGTNTDDTKFCNISRNLVRYLEIINILLDQEDILLSVFVTIFF